MNDRLMRVRGSGRASAEPDKVTIHLEATSANLDYGAAIVDLNHKIDELRQELKTVGLAPTRLKTAAFSVESNFDPEHRLRRFIGYEATHALQLTLPFDKQLLNNMLSILAVNESQAEFSIEFSVGDEETLRQRSIADAVENAKRNADSLAQAASVKLGRIVSVEYGWAELHVHTYAMFARPTEYAKGLAPGITPDDVSQHQTVTVVWEIE